jgi:hypothetical protein
VQLVVLDRADPVLERILMEYFDGEYHHRQRREALES